MSRKLYCAFCRRHKDEWQTPSGFAIEEKIYCCMGCGFSGCTCDETATARRQRCQISLAAPSE